MQHHTLWKPSLLIALAVAFSANVGSAQEKKPAKRAPAKRNRPQPSKTEIYKTVGDVQLTMNLYNPQGHKAGDKRPAVVFFFGGGWRGGSTTQFAVHSAYLASRGMVAMTADYRVYSRHKAKVIDCVADAKSAIRWARKNAKRLGIDPDRIAAGGGSAGGHLAAAVAVVPGFEEEGEDKSISSRPSALLLFNPALDLAPEAFGIEFQSKRYRELATRFGTEAENISPTRQVTSAAPPTIVFHGKDDTTVPYSQAENFAKAMKAAGCRCELAGYKDQDHGFFNFGRNGNENFVATVTRADEFLVSLGYLQGKPTVEEFLKKSR